MTPAPIPDSSSPSNTRRDVIEESNCEVEDPVPKNDQFPGVHSLHPQPSSNVKPSGAVDEPSRGDGTFARRSNEELIVTVIPWYRRALISLTMYGELSVADVAEEFAPVRTRLQQEWIFDAGFLVALSSANAAVFAVSPDSVFKINSHAYTAIATSSAACGLGIACDVWFLLRYNWVDLDTFIYRSRDVYDSYAFFSISSRMPTLCMLLSAISLMAFLGLVAYDAWPRGVLVIGLLALLLMLLQFIVYGMHRFSASALTTGRHLMGKVGQSFWSSTNGHRGQV